MGVWYRHLGRAPHAQIDPAQARLGSEPGPARCAPIPSPGRIQKHPLPRNCGPSTRRAGERNIRGLRSDPARRTRDPARVTAIAPHWCTSGRPVVTEPGLPGRAEARASPQQRGDPSVVTWAGSLSAGRCSATPDPGGPVRVRAGSRRWVRVGGEGKGEQYAPSQAISVPIPPSCACPLPQSLFSTPLSLPTR